MPVLYLAACPMPADEMFQADTVLNQLKKQFPAPEATAYIEHLSGVFPRTVRERLTAFSLLPVLLTAAGIPTADLYPCRDSFGRPYLRSVDGHSFAGWDFNLSHTAAHAVCALWNGEGKIGIDAEEPIPAKRAQALLDRFGSEGERRWMEDHAGTEPLPPWEGFVRMWTIREALGKQEGRGEPLHYDSAHVPDHVTLHGGHFTDTGAALTICVPKCSDELNIILVSGRDILSMNPS